MHHFGHFSEDNTEFIITNPKTPSDYDNYLFNEAIFANAQQTGIGYTVYQIDGTEMTELSSVTKDVCNNRDSIMNRLIYIRDNDTGEVWNVNWEPVKKKYGEFTCRHGLGYTIIDTEVEGLNANFRIFVPSGKDPVELWTLRLKNGTGKKRNLSVFVYYEFNFHFMWGFDTYGSLIYMHAYYDEQTNAMITEKHPEKKPHPYLTGFMTSDVPIDYWDGSKIKFFGRYNQKNEPEKVLQGQCSNTEGTNEYIGCAIQYNMVLEPAQEQAVHIVLGVGSGTEDIVRLREKYLGNFEQYFEELRKEKQKMIQRTFVKTPDAQFDRMMNIWAKQQALYGATWTRWGFRGYRDIVQHAFGVTDFQPERTKAVLLKALNFQYSTGAALRGWDPVDTKEYSDSALWLIFTLTNYMKETGDLEILDVVMDYYDKGSDTVLAHIEKALEFLENNKGKHGLNLIKFGDWNDSLTAIGKEGRGESVWLSMAYAKAVLQVAELMQYIGNTKQYQLYMSRYETIKKAINAHAWDGDWYLGCYTDDYEKIYSKECEEGKMYINTQSWSVIAGICDDERYKKMCAAADKNLLTEYGYLLSYPTFSKFNPSVGRITAMEPGIAENATVYSHGNAFMYYALLIRRDADKAYDIFRRITPGYENGNKNEYVPYVYTNCYFGPQHRHSPYQMEYSWITGSVGWFYNIAQQWQLGLRREYDGLYIDPQIPSDWKELEIQTTVRNKRLHVRIVRGGRKAYNFNGVDRSSNRIGYDELKDENQLTVCIE